MDEIKSWYIAKGEKTEGPYTENEIKVLFSKNIINKDTYIVDSFTMNEWKPYSDCFTVLTKPELPKIPNIPPIPGAKTDKMSTPLKASRQDYGSILDKEISENKKSTNNLDVQPAASQKTTNTPSQNDTSGNNTKPNTSFTSEGMLGIVASLFTLVMMFMPIMRIKSTESYGDMLQFAEKIKDLARIGEIASYFPYVIAGLHILALLLFLAGNQHRSDSIGFQYISLLLFIAFCLISWNLYDKYTFFDLIPTIQGILLALGSFVTAQCYKAEMRIRKKKAAQ